MLIFLQYLDPNGEGTVKYLDFLPLIGKRLQIKETADQLLVPFMRICLLYRAER
jgi:hypothetical protein